MIIFDLDGTLANCEHRRHFVEKCIACDHWYQIPNHPVDMCNDCKIKYKQWKPDWKSFYQACDKDEPIEPVMRTFSRYWIAEKPCHVEIWSGRCESTREKTLNWVFDNYFYILFNHEKEILNGILKMRPIGDNTPDDELKEKWLDEALAQGKTIDFVFDSNKKSIEMWKRRGIFVFDVDQNGDEF